MKLTQDFRAELTGPWETARGYLVEQFDHLIAQANGGFEEIRAIVTPTTPQGQPIPTNGVDFVPKLTYGTNVSGVAPGSAVDGAMQWLRNGDVVCCGFQGNIVATSAGVQVTAGLSLPVLSDFRVLTDLGGGGCTFAPGGAALVPVHVMVDVGSRSVQLAFLSQVGTAAAHVVSVNFTYRVRGQ